MPKALTGQLPRALHSHKKGGRPTRSDRLQSGLEPDNYACFTSLPTTMELALMTAIQVRPNFLRLPQNSTAKPPYSVSGVMGLVTSVIERVPTVLYSLPPVFTNQFDSMAMRGNLAESQNYSLLRGPRKMPRTVL